MDQIEEVKKKVREQFLHHEEEMLGRGASKQNMVFVGRMKQEKWEEDNRELPRAEVEAVF